MATVKFEFREPPESIMESIEQAINFEAATSNTSVEEASTSTKTKKPTSSKLHRQKKPKKTTPSKAPRKTSKKKQQSDNMDIEEPSFPLPGQPIWPIQPIAPAEPVEPIQAVEAVASGTDQCDAWKPASEMMPELPDKANPVDKEIFQRLADCWDEEAKEWTAAMRRSLIQHVPRARVTKSTARMSNHNLAKLLRGGQLEPEWGSFVVLRTIFGLSNCAKYQWFQQITEKYPQAREPAYDGVCQEAMDDVFDGKAELPPRLQRKRGIRQLGPERRRSSNKKAKLDTSDDAVLGRYMLASIPENPAPLPPQPEHVREQFTNTVEAVQQFKPQEAILSLKQRYDNQVKEMERLAQSNQQILEAINQYRGYVGMLRSLETMVSPTTGNEPSFLADQPSGLE